MFNTGPSLRTQYVLVDSLTLSRRVVSWVKKMK